MIGIKISNSKNIIFKNSKSSGFEKGLELDNVENFLSENNEFSKENDPEIILSTIIKGIKESALDKGSKKRLYDEMIMFLSSGKNGNSKDKENIKNKILKVAGNHIADYFVQLAAAVSAGFIINSGK